MQLSYSQTESNFSSDVVQECRGLILERGSWNVVAMPFKKFFNYGEQHADRLDWGTAKVYEKLDGSLLTLYFHSGEWHVATSKLPAADGKLPSGGVAGCGTFAELFWSVWRRKGYRTPESRTTCYMFELCNPPHPLSPPTTRTCTLTPTRTARHRPVLLYLHAARSRTARV